MERCSYFIKNKALFGCYPTQEDVDILEKNGVCYFIDLTCYGERGIRPYKTKHNYFRYSIIDRNIPSDWSSFSKFILSIISIIQHLKTKTLIYIHCKGGHGRSGIVVASILCQLHKITPAKALILTANYHNKRKEMKRKRRIKGSPPEIQQKRFVKRFFSPLFFHKDSGGITTGMSNLSPHSVEVPLLGTFSTSNQAFHAYKNIQTSSSVWENTKNNIMEKILTLKFNQNKLIRKNLLSTGLRPLVHSAKGRGKNNKHKQNTVGKLLVKMRNELYRK